MHFQVGGKMQISLELELWRATQDQIRNQRPRLRRNTLILDNKGEGGNFVNQCQFCLLYFVYKEPITYTCQTSYISSY